MLDGRKIAIRETVEARKSKIPADQAWNMLRRADEIIVARGSRFVVLQPSQDSRTAILDQCLGRSGTLRAPVLKIGQRYLVGFNRDMYKIYLE